MDIKSLVNRGKTNVNITIDKNLLKEINEFKKKHKIEQLSPMINAILWDWVNKQLKQGGELK